MDFRIKLRPLAALLLITSRVPAQSSVSSALGCGRGDTPRQLGHEILRAFESPDSMRFAATFPFREGQAAQAEAIRQQLARRGDAVFVLRQRATEALLLVGAYFELGQSGDETLAARGIAGVYRAVCSPRERWRLDTPLPADSLVRLRAHDLRVDLQPGHGLVITDVLRMQVRTSAGIWLRLNRRAERLHVTRAGRPVSWRFAAGVLWLDVPVGSTEVTLSYRIDVARDSLGDPNSGAFTAGAGHVRGQYGWHPFVWFDDVTQMRIRVVAPLAVHIATDLPQTVTQSGTSRVVVARSAYPVATTSLFYDAAWRPRPIDGGTTPLMLFATDDFHPSAATLRDEVRRVGALLHSRFGAPPTTYRAIVQQQARGAGSRGWPFMSNHVIAANQQGGPVIDSGGRPRAFLAHEVAHAWTHPSGPARNLFSEGWATWVESLALRDRFGAETERAFWAAQRERFVHGGYEGRARLADDPGNNGVSYSKGAWVLRMLADEIGERAIDQTWRCAMHPTPGRRLDLAWFRRCLTQHGGRDVGARFDRWVNSPWIPILAVSQLGDTLTIRQEQPDVFRVPLDIAWDHEPDTITVQLQARETRVVAPRRRNGSAGPRVTLDPRGRLLWRTPTVVAPATPSSHAIGPHRERSPSGRTP